MTDNNQDLLPSPWLRDSSIFYSLIKDTPNLGFWQLTVEDAAGWLAIDMWFQGLFPKIEIPKQDIYNPRDPALRKMVSEHCSELEGLLTAAIDRGTLKATKLNFDFDDRSLPDHTLVNFEDLKSWLKEHGYELGEAFEDFTDIETIIYNKIVKEIYKLRVEYELKESLPWDLLETRQNPDQAGIKELRATVKELTAENVELSNDNRGLRTKLEGIEESYPKRTERPMFTLERRTLLTIIASLCKEAGINYQQRGAAKRLSELTEEIGAAVTDETIRKIINDIDDALETRMQ